jgi:hypothetical protein
MLEEILADAVPHTIADEAKPALRACEVFLIDNVAEYLYAQTDQEIWDAKSDFPCLAPPFPSFWMEFGRPSRIVSSLSGVTSSQELPYRVGLWFDYAAPEEVWKKGSAQGAREQMVRLARQLEPRMTPEVRAELKQLQAEGASPWDIKNPRVKQLSGPARIALGLLLQAAVLVANEKPGAEQNFLQNAEKNRIRWIATCQSFMQISRHGPILGPLGRQALALDETGTVIDEIAQYNTMLLKPEQFHHDGEGLSTIWFSGLLAISFCHCKNVSIRAAGEVPEKLAKRQRERGRLPGLAYKVLEIGGIKTALGRARAEHATGLRRALHICRGHFALYAENGLFGKYRGRFWIPQHLRGEIEQGAVEKVYDVRKGNQ